LKCEKDEIVFLQGDVADAIFYIQKGKIKLTVVSDRGKEAVVGLLGAGHFFGESCLNRHPLRITTATAIEECLVTRIAKEAMIATLHDQPNFSELFTTRVCAYDRPGAPHLDQTFSSGHNIMIDNAPIVIQAIRMVVDAVRAGQTSLKG
jgi:CRP/FNR family transcriptional regulator, cyclic AMP receptor protein